MPESSPEGAALRIAVFIDREDWHWRRLSACLAARGAQAVAVPLRDCGFDLDGETRGSETQGLRLPGFEQALPDAGFVRSVPGGSFEAVTLRLGVLHALRAASVPLWNDARVVERCVDKSMTSFLLRRAGLPTPPTWVTESRDEAAAIVARESRPGAPLVLKPLFGSQGRGLRLLEAAADLPEPDELGGVYYLQRFVAGPGPGWRDRRLLVAGGRVVAAMTRHGSGWVTNVRQGARCEALQPSAEEQDLARAALGAVGAGYAGVDLIEDQDGRLQVLEVNSQPSWSALQRVAPLDVTGAIVDSFLSALRGEARRSARPSARPSARNASGVAQ